MTFKVGIVGSRIHPPWVAAPEVICRNLIEVFSDVVDLSIFSAFNLNRISPHVGEYKHFISNKYIRTYAYNSQKSIEHARISCETPVIIYKKSLPHR